MQPVVPDGNRAIGLSCDKLNRWFGGLHALKGVSIDIRRGEILGLVGPNGSGKTTAVNAITGFFPPQKGDIRFGDVQLNKLKPHQIAQQGIARTFQNVALFTGMSVLDNILLGRHNFMNPSVFSAMFYWWWAQKEEVANRDKVEEIIDLLQLESVRDEMVDVIPLGTQKRVELARALVAEPSFLILDEPMAGMNQEEKEYMVRFILDAQEAQDRKSTRLNSSHVANSYAVFCLKKKKNTEKQITLHALRHKT